MSKTTRKTYTPKFKTAVAIDVVRGDKTLSQVAAEHGVSPSLAAEWRDELLGGADGVFGKTQQDRERKRSEEAARKRHDEALPEGLPRARACELLGVSCVTAYRDMAGAETARGGLGDGWPPEDERLAALIDREHVAHPAYGARRIARVLHRQGEPRATRWRVARLMGLMGIRPCCPLPSLSAPSKASRRFPYLLRGKRVLFPNQVWSTDITYVQTGGRHMHLTAVIDWCSRYVVSWLLSDTMRAREVVACARDAFEAYGTPSVMNSDQGSVFGSEEYVSLLEGAHVTQSMDGRARRRGNVLMERWLRTLKSECLRNEEYDTPAQLGDIIRRFVDEYNESRPHQSLGYETPSSWYFSGIAEAA
ncbi:MAG: IS3 family transposase [Olsenella sp.]|nr:IS3 family transposase [Olsenella sp.]